RSWSTVRIKPHIASHRLHVPKTRMGDADDTATRTIHPLQVANGRASAFSQRSRARCWIVKARGIQKTLRTSTHLVRSRTLSLRVFRCHLVLEIARLNSQNQNPAYVSLSAHPNPPMRSLVQAAISFALEFTAMPQLG